MCLAHAMNAIMPSTAPSNLPPRRHPAAAWFRTPPLLALGLLTASLCAQPALADGLEGRFDVRSADLELKDGVYHLNARLALPVNDAVRHGLAEGVPLTVELDIDIERVR